MAERIQGGYLKVFLDFEESASALDDIEKGALLLAMLRYANGQPYELIGNEQYLFPVFKSQIDRDADAYARAVEKNRENGKLGGRPKKNPENPPVILET